MNNIQKSMRDIAFDLLSKKTKPVAFNKLWKEVSEILGLSEDEASNKIGTFYTHITLDGRFVLLENNTWDLRSRHKYEEIKIDMNALYIEEDDDSDLVIDDDGEIGYNDEDDDDDDDDDGKKSHKDIYEDDEINDI